MHFCNPSMNHFSIFLWFYMDSNQSLSLYMVYIKSRSIKKSKLQLLVLTVNSSGSPPGYTSILFPGSESVKENLNVFTVALDKKVDVGLHGLALCFLMHICAPSQPFLQKRCSKLIFYQFKGCTVLYYVRKVSVIMCSSWVLIFYSISIIYFVAFLLNVNVNTNVS